jgi:hypothetical protein
MLFFAFLKASDYHFLKRYCYFFYIYMSTIHYHNASKAIHICFPDIATDNCPAFILCKQQ